jgi:hypothetical protein
MLGRNLKIIRLARIIQQVPLRMFRFIEYPILFSAGRENEVSPSIFLLALPRSGSTVTYQAICHGLDVNYLSNIWNVLYQLPLVGGILSSKLTINHQSDFYSDHGFVAGLDGPAEGLRFWSLWLDCGLSDVKLSNLKIDKIVKKSSYLQNVISVLTKKTGRPFATSYLGHTLVPDRVTKHFKGALLIRLRRDPISNAISLLKSARSLGSDWFSVMPTECEKIINATEHERVAAQVYWLNRRLDDAECSDQMLTIEYENLCENPEREIEAIRDWCKANGLSVKRKFRLPMNFPCKKVDVNSDPDAIAIHLALAQLEAVHGPLKTVK